MLFGDEVIKVIIIVYVFVYFEVVCYIVLLMVVKRVGDYSVMYILEGILVEERGMVDWLFYYLLVLIG